MIKRVLCLNPPDPALLDAENSAGYSYFEPPLGLLYVYSYLKEQTDHDVLFRDLNVELKFRSNRSFETILEKTLVDFKPDLVALAALYYSSISVFHQVAALIKRLAPEVVVVMGGHYPTHLTERCLADPHVDYAILSEGELGLKDLIEALNNGNNLEGVEGIAFRRTGQIQRNLRRSFRDDFSDQGRLPWEDTEFSSYFHEGRNVLQRVADRQGMRLAALTATRGCPNACSFCSSRRFWNRGWRKRKVSHVIDEIRYLIGQYGINTLVFNDENIAIDRNWFHHLLDELQKLDITWISAGGLSIRTINDNETIEKMYASGIGLFNLAVESGEDATLKRIQKPLTIEETQQVVERIRRYGDGYIVGFAIVGFPFEPWQGVQSTLAFMENLDLDWKSFYCFQPFPGCDLAEYCAENDLMDGFDTDYGENYFAPKLRYPDYSSQKLGDENYKANLRSNFINNRNLRLNTAASLKQAERDFRYVLSMVPDHAFAFWGLSEVYRLSCRDGESLNMLKKAAHAADVDSFNWGQYLDFFDMDLKRQIRTINDRL